MLTEIRGTLSDIREEPRRGRMHPHMIEEVAMFISEIFNVLDNVLDIDDSKEGPPREQWEMLRSRMRHSERMLHHMCMEAGLPPEMFMRRFRDRDRILKDK